MDSPLDDPSVIRISLREPPLPNRHAIPGSNPFGVTPGRGLAGGTCPSEAARCQAAAGDRCEVPGRIRCDDGRAFRGHEGGGEPRIESSGSVWQRSQDGGAQALHAPAGARHSVMATVDAAGRSDEPVKSGFGPDEMDRMAARWNGPPLFARLRELAAPSVNARAELREPIQLPILGGSGLHDGRLSNKGHSTAVLRPIVVAWLLASALAANAPVRLLGATQHNERVACGSLHSVHETVFVHRQELLHQPESNRSQAHGESSPVQSGDIALIEATPEILVSPNQVDLSGRRLTIATGPDGFIITGGTLPARSAVAGLGLPINLGDDDFAAVELPFSFPFYGAEYNRGFVHSDGNLTFVYPDSASTPRSYSRAMLGPPRIAPLFRDLDPSQSGGVRMAVEGGSARPTWHEVPLFTNAGVGSGQTFQVVLQSDGRIEFRYGHLDTADGVVGIFPGIADRNAVPVDWSSSETTTVPDHPILAEVFSDEPKLDDLAIAHAFFRAHEDACDTLVLFNDIGLEFGDGSVAYAAPIRNDIEGIGSPLVDDGARFGSARRLSSFVNMGAVSSYTASPVAPLPNVPGGSMLVVLAHALGHRFLAYAPYGIRRRARSPRLCSAGSSRTGASSSTPVPRCSRGTGSRTTGRRHRRGSRPSLSSSPSASSTST